jgi:tetratricopeptide (TPR) repeat protein
MPGEADKALVLLGQALALDPDYPPAHALAAWCYEIRYLRGGMQEADKGAALNHAHAAIHGGPDDAGTLAMAGFAIGMVAHDYASAMEAIDRALTLTAASASALWMGSVILGHAGEGPKAINYAERSLRLLPFGRESAPPYSGLALGNLISSNFAAAVDAAAKGAQANPRFSLLHALQAAALASLGRRDEANAAGRRVLECEPDFTVGRFVKSHTGKPEIWEPIGQALRQAGLPG